MSAKTITPMRYYEIHRRDNRKPLPGEWEYVNRVGGIGWTVLTAQDAVRTALEAGGEDMTPYTVFATEVDESGNRVRY